MTGEQPKPQPMTASPLDKMAEGLLGRLVMGDIPEDEKADILTQLTGELRALRITLSAHGKVMLQQNELLESMQNMLAFWNNNLVDWVKDPEGKALKARVRSTLEKYTDIGYFDLIDTSEEVGAMVEELAEQMGAEEGGEPGEDQGGGEEGPVIDAEFREVPSRKS
jgi:hypothetical protein